MEFWVSAAFCDAGEYIGLARAADRLGFDVLTVSDHLFYADYRARYPYTEDGSPPYTAETHWPDAWVTIGAMAGATERVRFATNVYIAPARDLFTVAKAVSTAAALSGDRTILGVGAGWCEDEFLQTGQDFHTRGRRLDEMIPALRALLAGGTVQHRGESYDFGPLSISPVPEQRVPVFIGGDSDAALRRAARLGDGWIGNRIYTEDQLADLLRRLAGCAAAEGRTLDDLQVVAAIAARPSPDLYKKWTDRGVDATLCAPWWMASTKVKAVHGQGLPLKIATLERFADKIIARM